MSEVKTLAFVYKKAPGGGCSLETFEMQYGEDGAPKIIALQPVAFRSTAYELHEFVANMVQVAYEEQVQAPPQRIIEYRDRYLEAPRQPETPATFPSTQPPQPPFNGFGEEMPSVVDAMRNPQPPEQHSAIRKARDAIAGLKGNGAHALVFGLLCAWSLRLGNLA